MPTYYLDSRNGSDTNDGTSRSAAWKTPGPLFKASLGENDLVLFRSGGTYHGGLGGAALTPLSRGTRRRLTFGAYGSGPKPVLSGYKIIEASAWRKASDTVWQVSINSPAATYGNELGGAKGANIGFLEIDGVIHGNRQWKVADLAKPWDFHVDYAQAILSIFATDDPGRLAGRIAAAPNANGIGGIAGSTYQDLELHGFAGHGFSTYASDVTVENCSFHGIGGAQLGAINSTKRYGNGAQAWSNTSRVTIADCLFEDIYDVAFTAQGYPVSIASGGWTDITFARNEVYRSFQGVEFWSRYGQGLKAGLPPSGSGFRNCLVEDNRFHDMDKAWSAPVRDDPDVGAGLLLYMLEAPVNQIIIRRNLFEGMRQMIYARSPQLPSGLVFTDNEIVFDRGDRKLMSSRKETATQFSEFLRATGIGKGCTIKVKNVQTSFTTAALPVFNGRIVQAFSEIVIDARQHDPAHQWVECGIVKNTDLAGGCEVRIDYALDGGLVASHCAMGTLHLQLAPVSFTSPDASTSMVHIPLINAIAREPLFALVTRRTFRNSEFRLFVNTATLASGRLHMRPTATIASGNGADITFTSRDAGIRLPRGSAIFSRPATGSTEVILGSGTPASAPPHAGAAYVDLDGRTEYRAFGSSSYRDWIAIKTT